MCFLKSKLRNILHLIKKEKEGFSMCLKSTQSLLENVNKTKINKQLLD